MKLISTQRLPELLKKICVVVFKKKLIIIDIDKFNKWAGTFVFSRAEISPQSAPEVYI